MAKMQEQKEKIKPHYHGHRARMRDKLLKSKKNSLPDYEILEMLLFTVNLRGDTKPLAKELIAKFGNLARVISADPIEISKIKGMGESAFAILRIVQEAATRLIKEDITEKPIIASWKSLLDYCRATQGHLKTEQFRILYLNTKHMLIHEDLQEIGTIDHAQIYPREIMKRALDLGAASLILVHNHPSGDTNPSDADKKLTKEMVQILAACNIELHDHIIISHKSHFSFRSNGLL